MPVVLVEVPEVRPFCRFLGGYILLIRVVHKCLESYQLELRPYRVAYAN